MKTMFILIIVSSGFFGCSKEPEKTVHEKTAHKKIVQWTDLYPNWHTPVESVPELGKTVTNTHHEKTVQWTDIYPSGHIPIESVPEPELAGEGNVYWAEKYITNLEIGLRSDGVVVWRKREDSPDEFWDEYRGLFKVTHSWSIKNR